MPTSATLTTFNSFTAGARIISADVNANFSNSRGHRIAIDGSTTALADASYDLGSSDYQWRDIHISRDVLIAGSTQTFLQIGVTAATDDLTLTTTGNHVFVDASSTAPTMTLFTAVGNDGEKVFIKKTDSGATNKVTIEGNGAETIDGTTTAFLYTPNETVEIVARNSNWQVLNLEIPRVETSYNLTITGTTSAPTKGTINSDLASWERDGEFAIINYTLYQTGAGSAGSGTYLFSIPTFMTIATAALRTASPQTGSYVGAGRFYNGSTIFDGSVLVWNANNLAFLIQSAANEYAAVSNSNGGLSNATILYTFQAKVPISGWGK